MAVFAHPEFDDHRQVVFCHDPAVGLRAIIAIHNTNRGPALGGCRMWPYGSDAEALCDVLRLSRGMTYKAAVAGLALGGGKAVIIGDPRQHKTPALLHAMGDFVDSLSGRYITAEDSGTSVADLKIIGQRTPYACGVADGAEHGGDPSPSTAYGTFMGLKEAVKFRLDRDSLAGLKVAVQGVGNVGFNLVKHLRNAGAEVFVTDIYPQHVERAVDRLGAIAVAADKIFTLDVDVFAPCAMGGIINSDTLPQLKAAVIAGAANNQLATAACAEQLRRREILYAPDYVINAGGIIDIAYQRNGGDAAALKQHLEQIADTLRDIFTRSEKDGVATSMVADAIAEERFNNPGLANCQADVPR